MRISEAELAPESNTTNPIPDNESHGSVLQQGVLWAGLNINVFNVVLGGVLIIIGLTFWQSVIAILVGTAVGAALIALHATQGPRLRVPQMIQSRGQFGFYGASFLFLATLVLNFGFTAAILVIQAQAMNIVAPALSVPAWIAIMVVPMVLIGVWGYRQIHRVAQLTVIVVGITLVVMFVQAIRFGPLPRAEAGLHAPSAGLFLAGVALLVVDLLSYGPFVSDYSRYLPRTTSGGKLFGAIWVGNVVSTAAACVLGAYITALLPNLSTVGAIGRISGSAVLVIMALSLVNPVNAYTGGFQLLALAQTFRRWRDARPSWAARFSSFLAVTVAGTVAALLGYQSFVTNLSNFLDVLLMLFIPWSAVNLTDFFLVRHGNYDVDAFQTPGGVYGNVAWRGMTAYLAGLVAEVPFVSQTYYTGPLVRHLGGADISWIVGFVVAGGLYYTLSKARKRAVPEVVPVVAVETP